MPKSIFTIEDCEQYLLKFTGRNQGILLEANTDAQELTQDNIDVRIDTSINYIQQLARQGDKVDVTLIALLDQVQKEGKELLLKLEQRDVEALNKSANASLLLEAIVKTDGSRPSFLIRDDRVDLGSSPIGYWGKSITVSNPVLEQAATCVGRIESGINPLNYWGTGFLIADDLLMTNRHVLQAIATLQADGQWQFKKGTQVNFGREKFGASEKRVRQFSSVVYYGKDVITRSPNINKLDLVLISLLSVEEHLLPRQLITPVSDVTPSKDSIIYIIGYPGPPRYMDYQQRIISHLFAHGFGYKRLAPGKIISDPNLLRSTSFLHDATTLGGNSGSPVLIQGSELFATGLHYSGARLQANFAHALAEVRSIKGGPSDKQFQEILKEHGI